jgi:hypothetical protein
MPAAVTGLPDAQTLINAARAAMATVPDAPPGAGDAAKLRVVERRRRAASGALDAWKPAIDQEINTPQATVFMGYSKGTIAKLRQRKRIDQTPEWPEPDNRYFPSDDPLGRGGGPVVWKVRTIIIARAEAPGRGHPGVTLGRTNEHKRRPAARSDGA